MSSRYIAYYRVSTQQQGQSGLGLDAQRAATNAFLSTSPSDLISEFTEVESGKRAKRPKLAAAIAACRKEGAILLIAKLDRLARNVHFISGLLESGVRFTAVDMPNADKFMLHVYAAMAEEEGRRISERTKAALAAAKARGVRLGANGSVLARRNRSTADKVALEFGPRLIHLNEIEGMSYRAISDYLNTTQSLTANGARWHPTSVYRLTSRYRSLSAISL
ncbi:MULTISPECIES: recombinase family protein [Pacificibacter]|uniref:recombinase family protein n=1 Tax=Pacificibacter TaxID=1042323 RepID=UPI001C09CFC1|nr:MULTISPECIES: recombinase family protein [Pacificibacter]MBU2937528.1 recombinase family protein [Pacificibacter marinus]MDO6615708.1 recombinase family protein [Pacificibacter sp. 1_MG-2023]